VNKLNDIAPMRKLKLIIPARDYIYNGLYNVFEDLHEGLKELNISHEMVVVFTNDEAATPRFPHKKINLRDLKYIIDDKSLFLIPDDYILIDYLYDNKIFRNNIIVWSHYFKGHRLLFSEYNNRVKKKNIQDFFYRIIYYILPLPVSQIFLRKYIKYLKRNKLVSQSIWSCLLLNRVYNLNCEKVIYLPIQAKYARENQNRERSCLIFFGGRHDTDFDKLEHVLSLIEKEIGHLQYYSFGNRSLSLEFSERIGRQIIFKENISRSELQDLISKMMVSVNPIYNGTFEMFPIESLICGTPVISFVQPFMEVTGNSPLVASIHSDNEIITKLNIWKIGHIDNELKNLKEVIYGKMDCLKISSEIVKLFNELEDDRSVC